MSGEADKLVAELRVDAAELKQSYETSANNALGLRIGSLISAFEALAAERDGMREALESFVTQARVGDGSRPVTHSQRVNCPVTVLHAARAALAGGSERG